MARKIRLKLGRENDRKSAIEILKQGQDTDFWNLIQQAIQEGMEHLQNLIDSEKFEDMPPDQYKFEMEKLKAKKFYLKKLKDYPNTLINELENPEVENYNFDPYSDPEFIEED